MALRIAPFAGVGAALGVLSHLCYFMHGEHHRDSMHILQISIALPSIAFLALTQIYPAFFAWKMVTIVFASFVGSLWTSMLVYRAFFHRLHSYPGPFMAKLTKMWHVSILTHFDSYKQLDKLHSKYGEYVRIGPTELSVIDPAAVEPVLGPRSTCTKAPWYDMGLPLMSLHQCRDRGLHDKRRRAWDRGFGAKALRNYESRVVKYAHLLVDQISAFSSKPVNASRWFNYYSFDVMSDLAFGKSLDMLQKGETHYAIEYLGKGQRPLGVLSPLPWLFVILTKIPGLSAEYQRFVSWSEQQAEERKRMKVDEPDIMSWLLDAEPMSNDPFKNKMWLTGDSRLVIVAGSDTTAATLSYVFYHLAKDPSQLEKLRGELKGNDLSVQSVRDLNHLNGVINEALRLHPPVPSGVLRLTSDEGLHVGDHYIPPNVTVGIPTWVLSRSEKCYERPQEFIPERWYSQPELVKDKNGFVPFSLGPFGCIGKQLALMELRAVVALLTMKFDVHFAPGEDGTNLLEKTEDYFTLGLGDMFLTFSPRKS